MPETSFRRLAAVFSCAMWFACLSPVSTSPGFPADTAAETQANTPRVAADNQEQSEGYLRIVDDPGQSIALEIASRTFAHDDGVKPTIALVSVAHIADRSFYDAIAEKLSGYDIVLYETVAPAGIRSGGGKTTEEKIQRTRQAMNVVASMAEQYRETHGTYPADLATLNDYVATLDPIIRNWFGHAIVDPWGRPLTYERLDDEPGYAISSAGPPQATHGRTGRITFDEHGSIQPMTREETNLQKQLAEALGLAYQLESLPYESPNWIISDMTAEDLYRAFSGTDVDFELFGGTIAGTSLPARLVGMLLRFIQMLDAMYDGAVSDMVKVLFIEILGDEEIVQASMKQMGPEFSKILIDKRNQVVIDDVVEMIAQRPEVESIAILYGAAHMADLAERLTDQLGYAQGASTWLPAITVDLTESKVDQRQLMQMRTMVRRMLQSPAMRGR